MWFLVSVQYWDFFGLLNKKEMRNREKNTVNKREKCNTKQTKNTKQNKKKNFINTVNRRGL